MTPKNQTSLKTLMLSMHKHRELIWQLTRREIASRYRGTVLGWLWPVLTPLCMLAVYTFVFSVVFQAKWGASDSLSGFSQFLFCGLIIYGFFAECIGRSVTLFTSHPNYITKIVFPLEILPMVTLGTAFFTLSINTLVLALFILATNLALPWTMVYFPLILMPLGLLTLACALALASLGVYLRDLEHLITILLTMLMFLSPIFYPVEAVPPAFRSFLAFNPIAPIIDAARSTLLLGQSPPWLTLIGYTLVALVLLKLCWVFYLRTKQGFADLI